jgi:hypothetical protein
MSVPFTFSAGSRRRTVYSLRPGSVAAMVPAGGGSNVISGRRSTARAAVPGAGARVLGSGGSAGPLGAEYYHLF